MQIRPQYLHPGGDRPFKVVQGNSKTLAHSDESYMPKYMGISWKPESTNLTTTRRCDSSKPTPIPPNGEATKPTRNAKKNGKEIYPKWTGETSTKAAPCHLQCGAGLECVDGNAKTRNSAATSARRATRNYITDMLPQPDLLSVEKHSLPLGGRSFPSLELQTSDLATSSVSPTPPAHACSAGCFACTTAESPALPQARRRYPRSQASRIHLSQLQPRPRPRLPCSSA